MYYVCRLDFTLRNIFFEHLFFSSSEFYLQLRFHGLHLVTPNVFTRLHSDACTSACTIVAIQHCRTGMWVAVQTYLSFDPMCLVALNDVYASELCDNPFASPPTQFILHKFSGGLVAFRSIENSRFLGYNVLGNIKINNTNVSSWYECGILFKW